MPFYYSKIFKQTFGRINIWCRCEEYGGHLLILEEAMPIS